MFFYLTLPHRSLDSGSHGPRTSLNKQGAVNIKELDDGDITELTAIIRESNGVIDSLSPLRKEPASEEDEGQVT